MESGSTGSLERTPLKVRFAMLAIVLVAAFAVPVTSSAGRGGGSGTPAEPWIALATVDGEVATSSSQPRLGSQVSFAAGYPTRTKNPWVSLVCYQDGVLVYGQGGSPASEFYLGAASSVWVTNGGAATCKAELGDLYWRGGQQYYTYMAETWFEAEG